MFICNFEINFLDFYSVMSTFCNAHYIEMHNYIFNVSLLFSLFFVFSGISAVFPVIRVFPVYLGTDS